MRGDQMNGFEPSWGPNGHINFLNNPNSPFMESDESALEARRQSSKMDYNTHDITMADVKGNIKTIIENGAQPQQLVTLAAACEGLTDAELDELASTLKIENPTGEANGSFLTDKEINDILTSLSTEPRHCLPSIGSPLQQQTYDQGYTFDNTPFNFFDNFMTMENNATTSNQQLESHEKSYETSPTSAPISSVLCNGFNSMSVPDLAHGVVLKYNELWCRLHDLTNEMIVSTKGRQLFPPIDVTIPNLPPERKYQVWLRFECEDPKGSGWRWTEYAGWQLLRKLRRTTGLLCQMNTPNELLPQEFYTLPNGPFTGEQIMKDGLSFAHAKITNKPNTKAAVFIESFHSYIPVVYLAPVYVDAAQHYADIESTSSAQSYQMFSLANGSPFPPSLSCHPSELLRFPLTLCRFIACTAYHNKELAQIKILANPQTRGTRVLGNISPDLAKEFVSGELSTETDIGKHKEQFLRRCASLSSVCVMNSEMEPANTSGNSSDNSTPPSANASTSTKPTLPCMGGNKNDRSPGEGSDRYHIYSPHSRVNSTSSISRTPMPPPVFMRLPQGGDISREFHTKKAGVLRVPANTTNLFTENTSSYSHLQSHNIGLNNTAPVPIQNIRNMNGGGPIFNNIASLGEHTYGSSVPNMKSSTEPKSLASLACVKPERHATGNLDCFRFHP